MTRIQKSQNEECWILSPNPTNTHSVKHEFWSQGVSDIDDSPALVVNSYKKKNSLTSPRFRQCLFRSHDLLDLSTLSLSDNKTHTPTVDGRRRRIVRKRKRKDDGRRYVGIERRRRDRGRRRRSVRKRRRTFSGFGGRSSSCWKKGRGTNENQRLVSAITAHKLG